MKVTYLQQCTSTHIQKEFRTKKSHIAYNSLQCETIQSSQTLFNLNYNSTFQWSLFITISNVDQM